MTIDERLEKLTERHEALTQTVGIIAGMQKENKKALSALGANIERYMLQVGERFQQIGDHIDRMASNTKDSEITSMITRSALTSWRSNLAQRQIVTLTR